MSASTMPRCKSMGSLCSPSRFGGFAQRLEQPKALGNAYNLDAGVPFAPLGMPMNSINARSVSRAELAVPHVNAAGNITQIHPTIVRFNAVDVVYLVRLFAGNYFPNNTVCVKSLTTNAANVVAPDDNCKCSLARMTSVPPARLSKRRNPPICKELSRSLAPNKHARVRVIIQKLAQNLRRRQGIGSHVMLTPSFGQGRAVLAHCFRPVFHSRITVCSQAARYAK